MTRIVLFDGECNFCNASVRFILERDPDGQFQFAPLQSATGRALLADSGIGDEIDSIVLIEDGRPSTYSTAALRIARRLSAPWSWTYALILVPRFLRDWAYRLFAKYRYRLFGKRDECMIPTPDMRSRFLEMS